MLFSVALFSFFIQQLLIVCLLLGMSPLHTNILPLFSHPRNCSRFITTLHHSQSFSLTYVYLIQGIDKLSPCLILLSSERQFSSFIFKKLKTKIPWGHWETELFPRAAVSIYCLDCFSDCTVCPLSTTVCHMLVVGLLSEFNDCNEHFHLLVDIHNLTCYEFCPCHVLLTGLHQPNSGDGLHCLALFCCAAVVSQSTPVVFTVL